MKGVIFNVVQEVVVELYGADTWDDLLDAAGLDGSYTALGNYGDEELIAIVGAASSALGVSGDDVLRLVGRHALAKLAARVPDTMTLVDDAYGFIRQVNDIIHPEVLKLYPDSIPPAFAFEESDEGMIVRYRSARHLPALAEGLLCGVGDHFGQDVSVEALPDDDGGQSARFLVIAASRD